MGRREEFISAALLRLKDVVGIMAVSGIYESDPMYVSDQPPFLNGVVTGRTELGPFKFLEIIKQIERETGRKERERNGPREIDLDLVLYGSLILRSERLEVPHPRLAERRFVLEPLSELEPSWNVPGQGLVSDLVNEPLVRMQTLERIGDATISISGV